MNVVCIGSGYVGSVTGAAFAAVGHNTTILDIDKTKIELLKQGKSPIYEPGLDYLISQLINKKLHCTNDYACVADADVIFIGVGTPSQSNGCADLKYIRQVAKSLGNYLRKERFTVIVNKSTVPIGTFNLVSSIILEESNLQPEVDFSVVSNPEFLREGVALNDVFFPDRIVIGSRNERAKAIMRELYEPFVDRKNYDYLQTALFRFEFTINNNKAIYFETDTESSELIKYASNAFLAVKISYINEIARFCEKVGGNALEVAKGMGLDSRIGDKFLQISSGWQGSCFPKDTLEIYQTSKKYGCELTIVKAAIESNFKMHKYIVEKIINKLGFLNGKTVGILGLTFKPNTDDARKTQAEYIIPELLSLGASVHAYDPQGMDMFKKNNPALEITYCTEAIDTAINADCILLLTHWDEFLKLDWEKVYGLARTKYILDTRNFLDHDNLKKIGFDYQGLGKHI